MREHKTRATYITVPRKLVIAWVVSFLCMMIMTALSVQWANYIDRRSNQRWCGIVTLFNNGYRENPPPNALGKQIASEMRNLQKEFRCK